MGFIKAFSGAIGGTLADQWVDFLAPPARISPTAVLFPAVASGQNSGRGSNTKGSENIITDGSRVIIPEGFGLVTFESGRITNFVAEAGGYVFNSDAQDAQSLFTGGGFLNSTLKTSWERFKFGGRPGSQQLALFVNLKEIPNNRFGTQSRIYWDDRFLGTQVGALTRGTYTLKVVDPILFVSSYVPATYIVPGAPAFDLADMDNAAGEQLFNEVVSSLAGAFSRYVNDPDKDHRITRIQGDTVGFANSLSAEVEQGYSWTSDRGIKIEKVAITSIEYDEITQALLADAQRADALAGSRGDSFLKQAAARGIQSAGENGGGDGLAFMGMGIGAMGNVGAFGGQAPMAPGAGAPATPPSPAAEKASSPMDKLNKMKELLEAGLISEEDYAKAKQEVIDSL